MRVTSKGQVTIPLELRQQAGIMPGSEVTFSLEKGRLYLRKTSSSNRGQELIAKMAGRGAVKMSTDEIMALTRGRG